MSEIARADLAEEIYILDPSAVASVNADTKAKAKTAAAVARNAGGALKAVKALAGPQVDVTGFVSDAALQQYYAEARVAVVPLRYGAGVKSKVVEALQQGLPLVTTSVGAQGLAGVEAVCDVHDDAEAIAAQVASLLEDDARWLTRSRSGASYAAQRFSRTAMQAQLLAALGLPTSERAP